MKMREGNVIWSNPNIFNCDRMFRKTSRNNMNGQKFTQERTYWSLVCEVLSCHPEGLKKKEIIHKIGFCASNSDVWRSLKHNEYIERIPKTWLIRLTSKGLQHLKDVFKENGFELDTTTKRNKTMLMEEQRMQGKINRANKDFH